MSRAIEEARAHVRAATAVKSLDVGLEDLNVKSSGIYSVKGATSRFDTFVYSPENKEVFAWGIHQSRRTSSEVVSDVKDSMTGPAARTPGYRLDTPPGYADRGLIGSSWTPTGRPSVGKLVYSSYMGDTDFRVKSGGDWLHATTLGIHSDAGAINLPGRGSFDSLVRGRITGGKTPQVEIWFDPDRVLGLTDAERGGRLGEAAKALIEEGLSPDTPILVGLSNSRSGVLEGQFLTSSTLGEAYAEARVKSGATLSGAVPEERASSLADRFYESRFGITSGLPGIGFGGIGRPDVWGAARDFIASAGGRMKETAFSVGSGVKEATGRSASELSGGSTVSTGGKAAAVESVQALLERLATQEREESLMGRGVRDIDRIDEYERAYQNVRERQKEMVIPASAVAQLEYGMRALQYGGAYGRSGYGRGPVYGRPSYPGASLIPAPTYPGISREGEAPSTPYSGSLKYPEHTGQGYSGKFDKKDTQTDKKIGVTPIPRITTTTTTTDTNISYETRDKGQPGGRIRKKLKNDKKVILETRPVPYYAGTVDPRGATPWEVKQIAKVVAKTKEPGWKFDHWEGDVPMVDSHKNPVTLLMFKDRKISAVFTKGETIEPTGRKLKDVPIFMPKLVYEENVLERYEGNLPVGKKVHSGFRRRPAAYGEREAQTLRIKSEEI
jgi:hypothetical protein